MRKVLITGGTGQLGIELLLQSWPEGTQVHAPSRKVLDLASTGSIQEMFSRERWDCIINCAAFTAVDAAEDNAGNAFLANCQGPAWLAQATAGAGIPLIHISTDYVFSGDAAEPYREDFPVDPVSIYGASKAAGELAVRAANMRSVIVRTAWVLSAHRSNFLKAMLRLATRQSLLRVVADQRGCPTSAADIAAALVKVATRQMTDASAPCGVYHFVNSGEASWYELALEIFRLSETLGGPTAKVEPIASSEYPTRANRPANSRLATRKIARDFGIEARDWRAAVADIMAELDRTNGLRELN